MGGSHTCQGVGPIVRLDRIAKAYGGSRALAGVDLSIPEGEFLTLLGPSGSGKTTILNILSGMVRPSAGRVFIRGEDVTDTPPNRRQLGMVFQSYALMPHMSIFENVAFPLRVRKVPEKDIRARVEEVLKLVQLPDVGGRKPRELSGGQQQRIAIARCLVYDPPIILMDEPLGALDRKLREQMQFEISRLHQRLKLTILYVTHDQEEALVLSDRICLVNNGAIEQIGTARDLYFAPTSHFAATFLGESNMFEGVVIQSLPTPVLSGPLDIVIKTDSLTPTRCGARLSFLVRPESMRILENDERACNEFEGEIANVIFIGGMTRTIVRIADGKHLSCCQLTGNHAPPKAAGSRVRIGWPAHATILLAAGEEPSN